MQTVESILAGCECALFLQGADGTSIPPKSGRTSMMSPNLRKC